MKNVNPNSDIDVASNLHNFNYFVLKIVLKIWTLYITFSIRYQVAKKYLVLFISLVNIEWIKASHVEMDLLHKEFF